jgi:hypothetical protein
MLHSSVALLFEKLSGAVLIRIERSDYAANVLLNYNVPSYVCADSIVPATDETSSEDDVTSLNLTLEF